MSFWIQEFGVLPLLHVLGDRMLFRVLQSYLPLCSISTVPPIDAILQTAESIFFREHWSNISGWFFRVRHVRVASRVELPLFHLAQKVGEQHAGYAVLNFFPKTKMLSKYESSVIWRKVNRRVWNTSESPQNHQDERPFLAPFWGWHVKRVDGPIDVTIETWLLTTLVYVLFIMQAAFNTRRLADKFLEIGSFLWRRHSKFYVVWSKHDFQDWNSPLQCGTGRPTIIIASVVKIFKNVKIGDFSNSFMFCPALRWRRVNCWMAWGDWGEIDLCPRIVR